MTYDELEPYYDRFDKLCGVSGKAGNLRGAKIEGGNIFEGPRQNEYPNPPLKMTESALMFEKAARELGYHPFPQPISNSSRPYVNNEGLTLGACQYCGHCDKSGCEANAKAGPQVCILPLLRAEPRFTLRARAWVSRMIYDKGARRVTGVVYTDTRTGEEYEQPAGLVVLSAYVFGNISRSRARPRSWTPSCGRTSPSGPSGSRTRGSSRNSDRAAAAMEMAAGML